MKRKQNLMRQSLRIFTAALACVAIFSGQANAQNGDVVAKWTFETSPPTTAGPHTAQEGTGSALGFHSDALAVYSNPAGNGSAESFSSNFWNIGDYYQFQTSTTNLDEIGLIFDHTRSNTGPVQFQLQYSTNGTTFTNFADPYTLSPISWSSGGTPNIESNFDFDLRSVAALNNQANVYFRLQSLVAGTATAGSSRVDNFGIYSNFIPPDPPPVEPDPRLPVAGDLVFGLNSGSATSTLKLVSGNAVVNGGVGGPGPWSSNNFIQSVEFDNNGGVLHNAKGNLLGVNFLSSGTGQIYSFATNGSIPAPAGQLIGNTGATGPVGQDGSLTATSLSGLSVSPNNSKIAVVGAGATAGNVIVYDYTAGDTLGAGAELANGRQTAPLSNALNPGSTQGTTWLDNDTVLAFSALGNLVEVTDNGTTLTESVVTTISTPNVGSDLTSLAYNPEVSPYVFAMYSGFASPDSTSRLYILDPANSYNLVNEVELSTSIGSGTPREIALDADGNLFIGGFGGVAPQC